jgi:transposase InsO family protein
MNNTEKDVFLHNLYYNEKYLVGRDLLFYKVSKTLGVKDISRRYIARWLAKQTVNQVYTNKKKPTNIRPIITSRPGAMLQMDLIDYSKKPQEGFKYILNVIDTFSRKVWLEPLKRKTIAAVIPQLNSIVQDIQKDYTIKVIQSDNGGEFNIAFPNITHIQSQPHTPQQNALVERSNGTVKKILNKLLFAGKIKKWDEDILLQVENV